MKIISGWSRALCAGALLMTFAIVPAGAEEPATAATADNARMHDRDGKRIYGYELMSETEISGFRALIFSIKDPAERDQARAEHRRSMDKRAAERGVKIKE